jgi:hypothetical protein
MLTTVCRFEPQRSLAFEPQRNGLLPADEG